VPLEGPGRSGVSRGARQPGRDGPAPRLMDLSLYVILDRAAARGRGLEEILDAAIAGGCRMIQRREKEWPAGRLQPLGGRLRHRCRRTGVTFIVSDTVALAAAA